MGLTNGYIIEQLALKIRNTTTVNTYVSKLNKLTGVMGKSIYDIAKTPHVSIPKIKELYAGSAFTQKNMIGLMLTVFKYNPDLITKKRQAYNAWVLAMKEYKSLESVADTKVTRDDLIAKYNDVSTKLVYKTDYTHHLLLSLLVHLPDVPRANYAHIAIVRAPALKSPSADYVYLKPGGSFLKLDGKKYNMPDVLVADIEKSIKIHPRSWLFVDSSDKSYTKQNTFNVFVIRTMNKLFGQKIGVNDLAKVKN